ncbi:hypothetical protein ACFL6M_04140 [Candidatus Eisenbacteria bacterium]|uniref:Right handed beta helix domain-containing protein n=1 Tax=Eiseniibacteriota bacterium TaxID=2212470 RepID=A0ABV6YKC6_UNCEI
MKATVEHSRRSNISLLLVSIFFLLLAPSAQGKTVRIEDTSKRIANVLKELAHGDTLLIGEGYYEGPSPGEQTFPLKVPNGVVVMGEPLAEQMPTIRCNSASTRIFLLSQVDRETTVQGLRILGESLQNTTGVWIEGTAASPASPQILNCEIRNCDDGIIIDGPGTPLIKQCKIDYNLSTSIKVTGATPMILSNQLGPPHGKDVGALLMLRGRAMPRKCTKNFFDLGTRPTGYYALTNRQSSKVYARGNTWDPSEAARMDSACKAGEPQAYNSPVIYDEADDPTVGRVVWWTGKDPLTMAEIWKGEEGQPIRVPGPIRFTGRGGLATVEEEGESEPIVGAAADASTWLRKLRVEAGFSWFPDAYTEKIELKPNERTETTWSDYVGSLTLSYGFLVHGAAIYASVGGEAHFWRYSWDHTYPVSPVHRSNALKTRHESGWEKKNPKAGFRVGMGVQFLVIGSFGFDVNGFYSFNGRRDFLVIAIGPSVMPSR